MNANETKKDSLVFTGLILLSGEDAPGIASQVFEVLSPFALTVLDIEQIVIRSRLLLTILVKLNAAHAQAVENDLMECADKLGMDLAISFSETNVERISFSDFSLTLQGEKIESADLSCLSKAIFEIGGNIRNISRIATAAYSIFQFTVTGSSYGELLVALSSAPVGDSLEFALVSSEMRGARKLVVLDVDSTLIDQEVIDLLGMRAGVQEKVAEITDSAMRGELDFSQSLAARVLLLKGLPSSTLEEVSREITLTHGALELISTLQGLGHVVALVTGGFSEIVAPLAKKLKIEHLRANSLEIKDGFLTGRTQGVVVDRSEKAKALVEFAAIETIDLAHTVAIGDGANDIDMLEQAGLGIAFMAKPILRQSADINIYRRDLARVLTLFGLPRKN